MKHLLVFIALFQSVSMISQVNLDSGLVAHYQFGETLDDNTMYINHGTSGEPMVYVDGIYQEEKHACSFNGVSQHVSIAHQPQIDLATADDFSISIWVKPAALQVDLAGSVNDVLSKWNGKRSQSYPYMLRMFNQKTSKNGRITYGRFQHDSPNCNGAFSILSKNSIADEEWHNIVMQKKDGYLSLYIDGSLQGLIEDQSICDVSNETNITLGRRTTNSVVSDYRFFKGAMDELRIYNRSLSLEEIRLLRDKNAFIASKPLETSFNFHPNPIRPGQQINIDTPHGTSVSAIRLYTSAGQLVEHLTGHTITTNAYPGVYIMEVMLDQQLPLRRRIVICP